MTSKLWTVSIYAAGFIAAMAMSYSFAMIGEPQSLWVWRDILGVLP